MYDISNTQHKISTVLSSYHMKKDRGIRTWTKARWDVKREGVRIWGLWHGCRFRFNWNQGLFELIKISICDILIAPLCKYAFYSTSILRPANILLYFVIIITAYYEFFNIVEK